MDPLTRACRTGDEAVVAELLERSEAADDLNAVGDHGTPLHEAIVSSHFGIARLLIEAGADVTCLDPDGNCALALAAFKSHTETMALLRDHGADANAPSVLSRAVAGRSAGAVRWLVTNGLSRNWANQRGEPALHVAARGGVPVLQELLRGGFAVNSVNLRGETAAHTAAAEASPSVGIAILSCLVEEYGANIHALDQQRRTLLHAACANRRLTDAVVAWLLDHSRMEKQVVANAEDEHGRRPLHVIAESITRKGTADHIDALLMLLEHRSDPSATTKDGRTPLLLLLLDATAHHDPGHLAVVCQSVRALCLYGATWDDGSERCLELLSFLTHNHQSTSTVLEGFGVDGRIWELGQRLQRCSGGERTAALAWREGIRRCVRLWVSQRQDSLRLTSVPAEVVAQGAQAIETYLVDLAATLAAQVRTRSKVCLVGDSEAGKTTLATSITQRQPVLTNADVHTVGIDLFSLSFTVESANEDSDPRHHEVVLWDFAGHDVYSVAHNLFYSDRTLYLLCVDIAQYIDQLQRKPQLSPRQHASVMDRFVHQNILRRVESIAAHQPDSEFLVVGTKLDLVEQGYDVSLIWRDIQSRIAKWKATAAIENDAEQQRVCEERGAYARCIRDEWIVVSCTDQASVSRARQAIETAIDTRPRGFEMGDKFNRVFEFISERRQRCTESGAEPRHRIESLIVPSTILCEDLRDAIDDLTIEDAVSILRTFQKLGDILWYDRVHGGALSDCIILDPLLVIDLVKEVVTHEREESTHDIVFDEGRLTHALLSQKPHWKALDDELTQAFKALLCQCQVAYPAHGVAVLWDSDLIVPSYWKTKLLLTPEDDHAETTSFFFATERTCFRWKYDLSAGISTAVFEEFAVRCHSSKMRREIVPNAIKCFIGDEYVARLVLLANESSRDAIRIDVAAADRNVAESRLQMLVSSMEAVLEGYHGASVARTIVEIDAGSQAETHYHRVEVLVHDMTVGFAASTPKPPLDLRWFVEEVWRSPGRLEAIQTRAFVREILDSAVILRKLIVSGEQGRLYPALWTVHYDRNRRIAWLRMLSDISGTCFHDAIEINMLPEALVTYGRFLEAATWVCTNVVPECISLGLLQKVVDEAASAVSGAVDRAHVAHYLLERMELATPASPVAAPFVSTSSSDVSPDDARTLLVDLLKLNDPDFDERRIQQLANLQCAEFQGSYVWAHADEINSMGSSLTRCQPDYSTVIASLRTQLPPSMTTAFVLEIAVQSLDDLRYWNRYKVCCSWKLLDASMVRLAEGKTSASSTCAWGERRVVVTNVDGVEALRGCTLQVQTERTSRISRKTKPLGEGVLALDDKIASVPRKDTVDFTVQIPMSDASNLSVKLSWRNATFA